MRIKYNEIQRSIEIDDNWKTQYWFVNVIAILNIINSVLFSSFVDKKPFEWFGFFWILIGLVSVILLTFQIFKRSASQTINISQIKNLGERNLLGRKTLKLNLTNGKSRDLLEIKNRADILKIKKLFQEIGIPTN